MRDSEKEAWRKASSLILLNTYTQFSNRPSFCDNPSWPPRNLIGQQLSISTLRARAYGQICPLHAMCLAGRLHEAKLGITFTHTHVQTRKNKRFLAVFEEQQFITVL